MNSHNPPGQWGEADTVPDRTCPSCHVHPRICICSVCRPIADAPELWVLQHPAERLHSKGTLRVARACLPRLRVLVGENASDFAPLRREIDPHESAVIFPGQGSQSLEYDLEHALQRKPRHWILIDGTWRKAKRILLSNPWLAALPRYHFDAAPVSVYRIRKRSHDTGLSTVEAIDYLLSLTHPQCDTRPLKDGLSALIEAHLKQMPEAVRKRYG